MYFTDKPKRKQPPARPMQRFLLAGFVFLCVAMIGFMLFTTNNDYVTCFDTPFPSLEGVEHHAFFTLPPSAQNFEYAAEGSGRQCTIWVRFEMDAGDFDIFRASTRVTIFEPRIYDVTDYHTAQKWIPPFGGIGGYGRTGDITSGYQVITVDTSDAARFTVYLTLHRE